MKELVYVEVNPNGYSYCSFPYYWTSETSVVFENLYLPVQASRGAGVTFFSEGPGRFQAYGDGLDCTPPYDRNNNIDVKFGYYRAGGSPSNPYYLLSYQAPNGIEGKLEIGNAYIKLNDATIATGTTYTGEKKTLTQPFYFFNSFYSGWDHNYIKEGHCGKVKFYENGVLTAVYTPYLDDNGVAGYYDENNHTMIYSLQNAWVAGPDASSIKATPSKTSLKATGETINIVVTCENAWTVTGNTWLTISSTGDTGGTTITATAPSYSGSTPREVYITFTDTTTSDTAILKIKQRKYISGQPFYLGGDEITEIFLGDDSISEAYLGEDLVFSSGPFVGLTASPNSIMFNTDSLNRSIKIRASESWTMTTPAWITASTLTGGTGDTIVSLTATAQQATTSDTITITSANYTASVSVNYFTIVFGGYVELNGPANVVLPFNPNVDYATNNYLRLEMNFDINSGYLLGGYINNSWFSYERAGGTNYWNFGNNTGVLANMDTNTNGYTTTYVMTIDNMNVSDSLGRREGISGALPNVSLPLAYTGSSDAGNSHFYEMKVYNSPTNLLYDFVGAFDGVNSCIYDKVSGNSYFPSGTGTVTYHA